MQQVEATGNFIVVRGLGRELDLAATAETAGDLLLLHDALHRIHSGIIGMIEGAGLVHAQTLGETAEIDRRAVVDVAAVAARGAADDAISLQHHNTGATPGQRQGGRKPGEAAAYHGDVGGFGQRAGLGAGEGRRRIVPVGNLFHSLEADQRRQAAEIRHLVIAVPGG